MGVIGGGGSILTVPIFVYLLAIEPITATAYSLFVVGATALVGAGKCMRQKSVDYKTAVVFAVPSFIAVYATRKFVVPVIPEELMTVGAFTLTRDMAILILFALVMVLAAISMIRNGGKREAESAKVAYNYPMIILEGAGVGLLTGLVGAGGGFMIIPALVLLAKLPMRLAVGTSLLIIAAKSLIGFIGDMGNAVQVDWTFLLLFTAFSVVGIFIGNSWSTRLSGANLKKGFGWFVLLMGSGIIIKEVFFPAV